MLRTLHPLLIVLVLAFVIRIIVSWHPGYGFDVDTYRGWTRSAVELGVPESYSEQVGNTMLPDYPPFSLIIFAGVGHAYRLFTGSFEGPDFLLRMVVKFPAILADLLICTVLFEALRRSRSKKAGVTGALVYALNPASIYDSAVWGQTDSIYALFLLVALVTWAYGRRDSSAVMLAISILTKFQAIVLFPLFFLFTARKPKVLLRFAIIGIVTGFAVLLPFIAGNALPQIVQSYAGSFGRYSTVSFGAYNFWWSLLGDSAWRLQGTTPLFGFLNFNIVGFGLFATVYALILWIFRREIRGTAIEPLLFCAALLSAAFFLFLPHMHERYLFPFIVFGVPLMFHSRGTAAAYIIMSLAFTGNLLGILPFSVLDRALYQAFEAFDVFVAGAMFWTFVFLMATAYRKFGRRAS